MSSKDLKIYVAGALVGALLGLFIAVPLRFVPQAAIFAEIGVIVAALIVTFIGRAIVHAMSPSTAKGERGQLTIGDLIGFALLAGLFVIGVLNIQFINDFAAGVQGEIMLGMASNAVDTYDGYYKALPCAGATCNVDPTTFKPTGATSSTVLTYTPYVWGDATHELTFKDESVSGGTTKYEVDIPRSFDTRVVQVLAQSGYTGTQTHLALISGQGIVAEP
jgi:hypothetical protein